MVIRDFYVNKVVCITENIIWNAISKNKNMIDTRTKNKKNKREDVIISKTEL